MKSTIALLGALLVAATGYAADDPAKTNEQKLHDAQRRLEEAAREIAELSGAAVANVHRGPDGTFIVARGNRAVLGVGIGDAKETEVDDGVAVLSVSPGGPAAAAGIKAGDVLVELNGKSLKRDKDNSPREKLLAEMGKVSPGDEVNVRYLREGKPATVKVKVDKPQVEQMRRFELRMPPGGAMPDTHAFREYDLVRDFMGARRPFGDMELVALTPKLAQYFGTDKGLLIVRAPDDQDIKLEDGDVLIDIDGRVPADPGHAFRILRSYQPGESVKLNIVRQKKKQTVAITLPEERRGGRSPRAPTPPAPPVPPA